MFIDRSMSREYAFQTASEYEVLRCEPFTVNIVVDAEQFNTYSQPSSVSWPRGYETRRPRTQAEYQNRWPVRCRPGLHSSPLYVGTWRWRHGSGGRFPELTWYRRRVGTGCWCWCRHGGYQEWRLSSKGPLNPLHWHKINCILCNTKLITPISLLQRPYILNAHYKNMPTRLSVVCNLWPVEQCVLRCQANTIHDTIFHLCLCICPYIFLSFSMRIIC